MELQDFKTKALSIKAAETGSNRQFLFELPAGTQFYNSWSVTNTGNEYLHVLENSAKVKLNNINYDGIKGYGSRRSHKVNRTPQEIADANRYYYGRNHGYYTMSWEFLWKQEAARQAAIAWLEKVTPSYTVTKEKGIITFENDKTKEKLRCDLGKQQFSRSYLKGKDRVIRYPTQFFKYASGRWLISLIEDENCKNFTTLVGMVASHYSRCRNFGTFLVRMFDHQHLEQYIAAGVEFDFNIPFNYSDFSKDIRAKLNENGIRYTQDVGSLFCSDINTGRAVFAQIKDKVGFKNMVHVLSHNIQPLNTLVNHYNYDLKALFAYCRERNWNTGRANRQYNYRTNQYEDIIKPNPEDTAKDVFNGSRYYYNSYDIVSFLRDYARMALDVHGEAYEKYPANLIEAHTAVQTLHSKRAMQINEAKFEETIDKSLEWRNKDFVIVYPKKSDEIIEEGKKLRHCVGSYIQSVIRGECKIVFLRQKDEPEKPFVTIEISGGNIRQARGYGNANPIYDARMALQDYAKEKKLLYRG